MASFRRSAAGRMLRTLAGLDVYPRRQIDIPMLMLGAGDGTWHVAPELIHDSSVVYSFGIGRDLRFESDLIARFAVAVHAFDPTPIALAWVAEQTLPAGLHVHPVGVAATDGVARFAAPSKATWESFSMVRREGVGPSIEAPVRRIRTLMHDLGHTQVDLIKMDIEGAEYSVLPDIIESGVRPRQVLIEFHHRWREVGARRTRDMIRLLQAHQYRIAHVSAKGRELAFVRTAP